MTAFRALSHRLFALLWAGLTALAGLGMQIIGLSLPLPVIPLAAAASGAALEAFGVIWANTLQELVPGDKLGRVAGIDNLGSFVLLPIGFALAGESQPPASWIRPIGVPLRAALVAQACRRSWADRPTTENRGARLPFPLYPLDTPIPLYRTVSISSIASCGLNETAIEWS